MHPPLQPRRMDRKPIHGKPSTRYNRICRLSEQVILFQNRRGFAPMLECTTCAWVPQCKQCDVSLTYHKNSNLLKCHYCGFSITPPDRCEACGDTALLLKGFGTEKIEEELAIFFPEARIARMDLDTTRSKYAYATIIQSFEDGTDRKSVV